MRSYYIWLLPLIGLCLVGLIIMIILDSNIARQNRLLEANQPAPISTTETTTEAANTAQSETSSSSSSSEAVAEIHEDNLADTHATGEATDAAEPISFDLGLALTNTLDSSLRLIKGVNSEATARSASQELTNLTQVLTGYATLSKLLPEDSQKAIAGQVENFSSSFAVAFQAANSHAGVESILADAEQNFMQALEGLK